MRTTIRKKSEVKRHWFRFDARHFTLGRLASTVARILMGKHHVDYTPHVDMGDHVVITYAPLVRLTGRKRVQKKYFRFSGYPGGLSTTVAKDLLATHPEKVIYHAVAGMLAKNRLAKLFLRRLKIEKGASGKYPVDFALPRPKG